MRKGNDDDGQGGEVVWIYIYMCVCVCVSFSRGIRDEEAQGENATQRKSNASNLGDLSFHFFA